jgi:hypothetical protein
MRREGEHEPFDAFPSDPCLPGYVFDSLSSFDLWSQMTEVLGVQQEFMACLVVTYNGEIAKMCNCI